MLSIKQFKGNQRKKLKKNMKIARQINKAESLWI